MRRAKTDVSVEFVPKLVQVRKRCSHDASAQRITNAADLSQPIARALLLDERDNFLGKLLAHNANFHILISFVCTGVHEHGSRLRVSDNFLDQMKIELATTESMSHDKQVPAFKARF